MRDFKVKIVDRGDRRLSKYGGTRFLNFFFAPCVKNPNKKQSVAGSNNWK